MYDPLRTVCPSRINWNVGVRLTRMWPSTANGGNTFLGMNLILLDSQDYHLHAFVRPALWNDFAALLVEGNVYHITNFVVMEARSKLKPVSSNYCIHFTQFTIAQPLNDEAMYIPRMKFELLEIGLVHQIASYSPRDQIPDYAIDAIGIVEDITPTSITATNLAEKATVHFTLYDGCDRARVILSDEHTESINQILDGDYKAITVVILASFKPFMIRGDLQLATLQSSKIYINPNHVAVGRVMQRIVLQGYQPRINAP